MSKLTKDQKIKYQTELEDGSVLVATVRHDDQCNNGHNTFSITGELYYREYNRYEPWIKNSKDEAKYLGSCGCLHEDITKHIPELAPYIKWHLYSTDGPLHYIANTTYHARQGKLEYARSTAIWPDATVDELRNRDLLMARLPALMSEFRAAVESLGLVY